MAVSEGQAKRGRRTRQMNGRRGRAKVCAVCGNPTRWLSVDGMCWDCTVKAAKNKVPIYIEQQEEETESTDLSSNLLNS